MIHMPSVDLSVLKEVAKLLRAQQSVAVQKKKKRARRRKPRVKDVAIRPYIDTRTVTQNYDMPQFVHGNHLASQVADTLRLANRTFEDNRRPFRAIEPDTTDYHFGNIPIERIHARMVEAADYHKSLQRSENPPDEGTASGVADAGDATGTATGAVASGFIEDGVSPLSGYSTPKKSRIPVSPRNISLKASRSRSPIDDTNSIADMLSLPQSVAGLRQNPIPKTQKTSALAMWSKADLIFATEAYNHAHPANPIAFTRQMTKPVLARLGHGKIERFRPGSVQLDL